MHDLSDLEAALFDEIRMRQARVIGDLPLGGKSLAEDPARLSGRHRRGRGFGSRHMKHRLRPIRLVRLAVEGAVKAAIHLERELPHAC